MRLALIHVLAWLFPLFLFTLAVYICEKEFDRLFGASAVELPPLQRLLPCPEPERH